ncbi:MAG: thiamine-phosphate kinase [Pseudomonadales bacterium]|nr:thiamine-phosphate kinase [Pseudomonadales bacterium]
MSQTEFQIIQQHFADSEAAFSRPEIVRGIGDDAAMLRIETGQILSFSMDVLVADVHFPATADPELIANRALAVNLSDLAAVGAQPLCFTLGLTLPLVNEHWLAAFSQGLVPLARQFNCPLVGGDMSRGPLNIAIQVQGQGEAAIGRDGARDGDLIYVTGCLGDSVLALASFGLDTHLGGEFKIDSAALSAQDRAYLHEAYYRPQPRIEFGRQIVNVATAAIDISDGLLGDLGHICNASALGAELELSALPLSDCLRGSLPEELQQQAALLGGDDYELCVTVAPENATQLESIADDLGLRLSRIGRMRDGYGIDCRDSEGQMREFDASAYQHFGDVE